jgi:hypothetical protein
MLRRDLSRASVLHRGRAGSRQAVETFIKIMKFLVVSGVYDYAGLNRNSR